MSSMPIVMHENPAWTSHGETWLRALSPDWVAVVAEDRWRVEGAPALQPEEFELPALPPSVPARLADRLRAMGPIVRFRTTDLWEAVATAIIRQVIRADQARVLHQRFRSAHGRPVQTPHGPVYLMPDATTVAALLPEAFVELGMAFKRRPLQAAAAAYLEQGEKWCELPPVRLVEELQTVPRIGPWTAGAAVADHTHDWTLYPYGDLAVRKWAALAAPDIDWPTRDDAFAARWRHLAGDQLGPLTLFTLAWGASHGHSL